MRVRRTVQVVLLLLAAAVPTTAQTPQGTAFTYQGRLNDVGLPVSSNYDFDFRLFDAATAGGQVGPIVARNAVVVTTGLFTASLDFGPVFTGNARWLEIRVRPAGVGAFQLLAPRQPLTPTPTALFSATVGDLAITAAKLADGSVTSAKIADGTVGLADLGQNGCATGQVMKWSGSAWTCAADWGLTGNAGTNPAANFIGTTDNQPLELRVNGQRALRLEPNGTSPNVVGGFPGNSVGAFLFGAVIGGGGTGGSENTVTGSFGTVCGGAKNAAGDVAWVGGGNVNTASGGQSSIGGGLLNTASGILASIGGGELNTAIGIGATIPGGESNWAGGDFSFAAGSRSMVRSPGQTGDLDGDEGTFAWADAQPGLFRSTGPNQFLIRAAGGVGINTNSAAGDLQIGQPADPTAFRFGNANARHHLISNREMVFNAFDADALPNGGALFYWRKNTTQFNENTPVDLMRLADNGNLTVIGSVSKAGGSFKIDHPLDPLNKYLYHSFVESPDMKNIYDGVVTTDADGRATVLLPEWFEALNRDLRYQLTVIGSGAWARARVAEEVHGNRFVVETDVPSAKVSWQVTGIRQDAWAEAHRIPVEEDKAETEKGSYLHPDAFAAAESRR